jgi:hypothetical protein
MNDTPDRGGRKWAATAITRGCGRQNEAPQGDRFNGRRSRRVTALGIAMAMSGALWGVGCVPVTGGGPGCTPRMEALPGSRPFTLIPVIPRTSLEAASWGLRKLASILPAVTRPGLELAVRYTQDADDLGEGGGDGGPPQVLQKQAPQFPAFKVSGAPQAPTDPNGLTAKLYCQRLNAWEKHARQELEAEVSRRAAGTRAWVKTVRAQLFALSDKPIPDTTGAEANSEFDAGASVFGAVQVAESAPRPVILFLGGLTALAPPSHNFVCHVHFAALVRSTDPAEVLHAVKVWSGWITRCGGTFQTISADDTPLEIVRALMNWRN